MRTTCSSRNGSARCLRTTTGPLATPTTAPCCRTCSSPPSTPKSIAAASAKVVTRFVAQGGNTAIPPCTATKTRCPTPDALRQLFDQTPFINGGLFDCLDSEEATRDGGSRIDCFSDNPKHRDLLSIPNRLFFGDSWVLIDLLDSYKFTVEENTYCRAGRGAGSRNCMGERLRKPAGMSGNPETRRGGPKSTWRDRAEAARERTAHQASRAAQEPAPITHQCCPVVDYMVDEQLGSSRWPKRPRRSRRRFRLSWRERLRYLLEDHDAADLFEDEESPIRLVRAIAQRKVLDPAVGSGAFPMGVLQTLTLALRRLDPTIGAGKCCRKLQLAAGACRTVAFEAPSQAVAGEVGAPGNQRHLRALPGLRLRPQAVPDPEQHRMAWTDPDPWPVNFAQTCAFSYRAIEQEPHRSRPGRQLRRSSWLPNLETRFIAGPIRCWTSPRSARLETAQTRGTWSGACTTTASGTFEATTRRTKRKYRR